VVATAYAVPVTATDDTVKPALATMSLDGVGGGKSRHSKQHDVIAAASVAPTTSTHKSFKPALASTFMYGGNGGEEFDHGYRKRIVEVIVRSGVAVDGITVKYSNGDVLSNGGDGVKSKHILLSEGEYINQVEVSATKVVHSLTFFTNKGRKLGPCGGKRAFWLGRREKVITVIPPNGYTLVGIRGRAWKHLDAIGFHWGPVEY